jgi:mRNA interferase RelE/StbE
MPWRVETSRRARRDLAGMSAAERAAVEATLKRLAADPSSVDLKKLAGSDGWRVRVGQWRILLDLDSPAGVMRVSRVLNRRDACR